MGAGGRVFSLLATLLAGLLVAACAGSPVSRTAQRGSSILVPVGPYHWPSSDVIVGFGRPQQPGTGGNNAPWADHQRGELEFYVDDGQGAGEIFLLRSTTVSSPSLAAPYTRAPGIANRSMEVIALLDVPVDAPLGQQTLRYRNKQDPSISTSVGNIWVLPREVLLCEAPSCGAPSGTPVVTGQPSPFVIAGPTDISGLVKQTIPDPQLIIPLPEAEQPVHAIEFVVGFPTSIAQVVDAYEQRTDRVTDLAWVTVTPCTPSCTSGAFVPLTQYRVKAVSMSGDGITGIALVFRLLGTTPVNPIAGSPDQVMVYPLLVRDQNGEQIEGFTEGIFFPLNSSTFYVQ